MPNPKAVGERSEGIVLAELLKHGKVVLLPFGNNQRYDLVVDDNGRFVRIQVKTGWWRVGCVCFKTNSVNAFTGKRTTYDGSADVFMVYSEHTGKVYCVPVSACGSSEVKLRVEPSTGRNNSLIRWAKDFELNGLLAPHGGIAQSAERRTHNSGAGGSNPTRATAGR
jgi:hypothetical protein